MRSGYCAPAAQRRRATWVFEFHVFPLLWTSLLHSPILPLDVIRERLHAALDPCKNAIVDVSRETARDFIFNFSLNARCFLNQVADDRLGVPNARVLGKRVPVPGFDLPQFPVRVFAAQRHRELCLALIELVRTATNDRPR